MPECWKLTGPPDDDYHLWCELNPCPSCHGEAEGYHEDEWNCTTGGYGVPWVCSYCEGTGIDPDATYGDAEPEYGE